MESLLLRVKKAIPKRGPMWLRPVYHFLLAFTAALFYGFPSRRMKVIGVTGTNGKTTLVELVHEILQGGGYRVASISSLRFRVGNKEVRNETKMTMPGRMFIQKFLHEAVRAKAEYAVLEVTSEGVKQFRHRFIKFHAAVVTNVSPEHIESHGGYENYLRAKLDLFWRLKSSAVAVINRADGEWRRFSAATAAKKMFYDKSGIWLERKHFPLRHLLVGPSGVEFEVNKHTISSPLLGEFNLFNVIAAVAVGLSQHVSLENIARALRGVKAIPGRMEFIQQEPFAVVVDYAHTPDSLKKVYTFLRESNPKSEIRNPKLICVLGAAGGGRDKWKRPELGKIAAEYCDEVILTNEDPYDENSQSIIEDIERGFSQIRNSKFEIRNLRKILDRRGAIREALKLAKVGDVVVITGKGAESWIMGPNNTKVPWDDREVVREELAKLV